MTFLSRLNYNFDPAKFGTATDPDGTLEKKLSTSYPILSTATTAIYPTAVASNTANSTYYQNPVAGICGTLLARVTSIYNLLYSAHTSVTTTDPDTGEVTVVDTYFYRTADIDNYRNALIQQLGTVDSNAGHNPLSFNSFISHTNRLSNLDRSNKSTRPDYSSGLTACQTAQKVVYQTENNLTDFTIIKSLGLGCFTSLFVASDLTAYNTSLDSLYTTANSLFATEPVASQTTPMDDCYSSFISQMSTILNFVNTRRTADENFYVSACSILRDVTAVNNLVNEVSSGAFKDPSKYYLINNYIGTTAFDALKT